MLVNVRHIKSMKLEKIGVEGGCEDVFQWEITRRKKRGKEMEANIEGIEEKNGKKLHCHQIVIPIVQ